MFFIIGAKRGGTSLLACCLEYHPETHVVLEQFNEIAAKDAKLFAENCIEEENKYPKKIWGNKILTDWPLPPKRWGGYENDLLFKELLPEAKILFIIRDGRTCVRSKVKNDGRYNVDFERACKLWLDINVPLYVFFKTSHKNNIIVRFEELILEPEKKLTEICEFLNIDYSPEMLKGPSNPFMPKGYRKKSKGTFDKTAISLEGIPTEYEDKLREGLKICEYC